MVRSGVNLDGVGVNPGESESSIFYYSNLPTYGVFFQKLLEKLRGIKGAGGGGGVICIYAWPSLQ